MVFQVIWFVLWGVLWAVYFMLDGFDLGAGILHNFISKNETEKKIVLKTLGPVWDGNEVWLLTAGGATFAAFPGTYASLFSYLYSALLLVLFSLIIRGVALEFREKAGGALWKNGWDAAILAGSLLPALLFGVAFGNIFRGLPIDSQGYHSTLLSLLNPYGLLTGVFFVLLFLVHGSLWLSVKTAGELSGRAARTAGRIWFLLFPVAASFLVYSVFETRLHENYIAHFPLSTLPVVAVGSLAGIKIFLLKGKRLRAFVSSCLAVVTVTFTGVAGLYPNLLPSRIDPNHSLTIFNSSSSVYTLKIMTLVALVFVPVIIAYQAWVYRIFSHSTTELDVSGGEEAY